MDKFSLNKDYEKAAIYRDRISALRDIQRDQSIAGYKQERHAVVEHTEGEVTKIGLTRVKGGWVTSHENFTSTKNLEGNIIENFIESHYFDDHYCPPIIVTDSKIDNKLSIERALSKFHKKNVRLVTKPSSRDKGLLKISKSNLIFSFEMRRRNKSLEHKLSLIHI